MLKRGRIEPRRLLMQRFLQTDAGAAEKESIRDDVVSGVDQDEPQLESAEEEERGDGKGIAAHGGGHPVDQPLLHHRLQRLRNAVDDRKEIGNDKRDRNGAEDARERRPQQRKKAHFLLFFLFFLFFLFRNEIAK